MNRQDGDTFLLPLLPHVLPSPQPHSSDGLSRFKLHSRIDKGEKTNGIGKHSVFPDFQHKKVEQPWEKRQREIMSVPTDPSFHLQVKVRSCLKEDVACR